MRALAPIAIAAVVGCGTPVPATDAAVAIDASIDAAGAPHTVTLTVDTFGMPGVGLRLADGALLAPGMGDVWLEQRSTMDLHARAPDVTLCSLGTFASLAEAPISSDACSSALAQADVIGTNMDGTDRWIGRTWWIQAGGLAYRARDLGDSVASGTDTLVLEYAPVP